jgi:hypothetical protein
MAYDDEKKAAEAQKAVPAKSFEEVFEKLHAQALSREAVATLWADPQLAPINPDVATIVEKITSTPPEPIQAPEHVSVDPVNPAPRLHDAIVALDEELERLDGTIGTTRWAVDCLYGAPGKDENIQPLTFPASDEGSITARILTKVERLKALDAHLRAEAQRLVDL